MQKIKVFLFTIVTLFFFTANFQAQARDQHSFSILKGEVSVTPAFCVPANCTTTTARLSGDFDAFFIDISSRIFFTASSLVTNPDLSFQLPRDPNADTGGTIRRAKYAFNGTILEVSGEIDSRAFDGPLISYTFVAEVINASFNPLGFYSARPDYRRCVSPLCGGYFVKRVNRRVTRCADGTIQSECYVAELTLGASLAGTNPAFQNTTPYLFQGRIIPKIYKGFGNLGVFKATTVFQSASDVSATQRFVGIENNGIACITSPCFSYDEYILNRNRVVTISSFNLDRTGASVEKIAQARKIIADGGVLPASGLNRRVAGFNGIGREFVAQQFFLPVAPIKIVTCKLGYSFISGACRTPFGCAFPTLELTTYSGVAIIDPVTGGITGEVSKSCVRACDFPAILDGPGQCSVVLP